MAEHEIDSTTSEHPGSFVDDTSSVQEDRASELLRSMSQSSCASTSTVGSEDDNEDQAATSNESQNSLEEDEVTLYHCLLAGFVLFAAMLVAMLVANKQDQTYVSQLHSHTFNIESHLNEIIVGQNRAVNEILNTLRSMTQDPEGRAWCQVLLLTGGPGVGKDYTLQLIRDHFYVVGGQECREHSSYLTFLGGGNKVHYCWRDDFNLYTFETLYSADKSQSSKAQETLSFISRLCNDFKRKLTVLVPVLPIKAHSIPSMNLKGVDMFSMSSEYSHFIRQEGDKVKTSLENVGVSVKVIEFRPLNWADLRQCVIRSVEYQDRALLSSQAIDEIVNLLKPTEGHSVDFAQVGCKDVDAMVALLPPKTQV